MSSPNPGTLRFKEVAASPSAPPSGYAIIYIKTDNVLYIKDENDIEYALGSASSITSLFGDITATGPGAASAVVAFVGGKSAADIAQSVVDTQSSTSSNVSSTIVKRDGSGNFSAGTITATLIGGASLNILKTGDTMSGDLNMNGNSIKNVSTPVSSGDVSNKNYVDTGLNLKVNKTGDTISGPIAITDTSAAAFIVDGNVFVVDASNNRIGINKLNPTEALDVIGNGKFTGTILASNLLGTNTGDITTTDTTNIELNLVGQDISADLTDTGIIATTYGDVDKVSQVTFDLKGRATSASNKPIQILESQVTGLVSHLLDKADKTTTISAGSGLVGGGDLSTNRTISMPNVGTSATYGTASSVAQITTDSQGRISAANDINIDISSTQINDFIEATQDVIGSILTDTNSIDFTYNDVANTIAADLKISTDSATAGFVKSNSSIHSSGLHVETEYGTPVQIGTSNFIGSGSGKVADADHVHAHGNQTSGTLHAIATTLVNGFMSTTDKTKLDAATSSNTPSSIVLRDSSGNFIAGTVTSNLIGDVVGNLTGNVTGNASGSATNFTGSLSGDVTGVQSSTIVSLVGGKSASSISTSVDDTQSATNLNTVSTIVKRNSNGDIAVRDISIRNINQSGAYYNSVISLVDAAIITTDASLGNIFSFTLGGNRTLGAPTNPVDGQKITYRIRQDASGNRTLSYNSVFNFPASLAGLSLSTSANAFDYLGVQYNGITNKWDVLAFTSGL